MQLKLHLKIITDMITDNYLKLTSEEKDFITYHYPEIDLNNLGLPATGMSSITNIDLLESTMRYDITNQRYGNDQNALRICRSLNGKINRYKGRRAKPQIKGFDVDSLCDKADKISKMATNTKIGTDMFRIDQAINYIRTIKNEYEIEEYIFSVANCLGCKLGEIMLDESLYRLGFDWAPGESYPLLLNIEDRMLCDPIGFIFNKLVCDNTAEDIEGTCSDFYYRFLEKLDQ